MLCSSNGVFEKAQNRNAMCWKMACKYLETRYAVKGADVRIRSLVIIIGSSPITVVLKFIVCSQKWEIFVFLQVGEFSRLIWNRLPSIVLATNAKWIWSVELVLAQQDVQALYAQTPTPESSKPFLVKGTFGQMHLKLFRKGMLSSRIKKKEDWDVFSYNNWVL